MSPQTHPQHNLLDAVSQLDKNSLAQGYDLYDRSSTISFTLVSNQQYSYKIIFIEVVSQGSSVSTKAKYNQHFYQYDIFLKTREKNISSSFFPCIYAVYGHRKLSSGANICSQWKMETGMNTTIQIPSALFIPYPSHCVLNHFSLLNNTA